MPRGEGSPHVRVLTAGKLEASETPTSPDAKTPGLGNSGVTGGNVSSQTFVGSQTFALTGLTSNGSEWNAAIPKNYGMGRTQRRLTMELHNNNFCYTIVGTRAFKYGTNLTILASAIQMGMAADLHGDSWDDIFQVCEHVFTIIFLAEMLIKLAAYGLAYFRDAWNDLDFIVAVASVLDVWALSILVGGDEDARRMFRMFRMLRLLRIVRMLRVVPELMLVVEGIVRSLRSMFWVFLLLAVMLYTVGIYCVDQVGSEGAGYPSRDPEEDVLWAQTAQGFNSFLYFGTVSRSMVSLFGLVLLSEWTDIVRPIWQNQPGVVLVFIFLVILTTFGVLNVIIGVVVERTTDVMKQVRMKDVARKKQEQVEAFRLISTLMFDLDTDNDRRISQEEMIAGAKNEKLHDLLEKVDMPHGFTYGELHAMLDQDGTGLLSKTEFINGMLRLVYNDEFQRDCLFQLSMGQIKANQRRLHRELSADLQQLFFQVTKEMNVLRRQLGAIAERTGVLLDENLEDFKGDLSFRSEFTAGDKSMAGSLQLKSVQTKSSQDFVITSPSLSTSGQVSSAREVGGTVMNSNPSVRIASKQKPIFADARLAEMPVQLAGDPGLCDIPAEDGTACHVHQLQAKLNAGRARSQQYRPDSSCHGAKDSSMLMERSQLPEGVCLGRIAGDQTADAREKSEVRQKSDKSPTRSMI